MFYNRKWRDLHQDSRESAATTMIHRKTQRNENVKFQKHNKSDWKKRDFHTSHAECSRLVKGGGVEEEETLLIRSRMDEDRAYW